MSITAESVPAGANTERPRLLLVDDDEVLLRSLRRILRTTYDVQCESNPYRGLVALEEDGPFAVIVSDLTMPGVDGIDFLERAHDEAPDTPRILLTGNATLPASIEAVNRARIDTFLTKPVSPDELLRWIDQAVIRQSSQDNGFDDEAEVHEGAATLMQILDIANPTACSLTMRVTSLVDHYLDAYPTPQSLGPQLVAVMTCLAELEDDASSPQAAADRLRATHEFDTGLVDRVLDLYLHLESGDQRVESGLSGDAEPGYRIVDLTDPGSR